MSIGQYFRDYDPFYELKRVRKDMNRYFQNESRRGLTEGEIFNPKIDIKESEGKYMIYAELPGVRKEDLNCWVEGDKLIISGEKKCEKREDNENVHRKEIQYGMFERAFNLPKGVKESDINCKMENGVLCVCFPKSQSELQGRRRSINIEYPTSSDVEGTFYDDRGLEVPRGGEWESGLREAPINIECPNTGDVEGTFYDDRGLECPRGVGLGIGLPGSDFSKGKESDVPQGKGSEFSKGKGRNENRPKTEGDIQKDKGSDVPKGKGSEVLLGKGGKGKVSDVPQGKGKGRNEKMSKTEGDIQMNKEGDTPQGKVSNVPQGKGRNEKKRK